MLKTLLPAFILAILIDPLSKTCHRGDDLRYHSPLCCHSLLRYQLPVSSSQLMSLVLLVNCFPLLHNIHTLFSLVSLVSLRYYSGSHGARSLKGGRTVTDAWCASGHTARARRGDHEFSPRCNQVQP